MCLPENRHADTSLMVYEESVRFFCQRLSETKSVTAVKSESAHFCWDSTDFLCSLSLNLLEGAHAAIVQIWDF